MIRDSSFFSIFDRDGSIRKYISLQDIYIAHCITEAAYYVFYAAYTFNLEIHQLNVREVPETQSN